MLPRPFEYRRPESIDAALTDLHDGGEGAIPYAGGTELLLLLKMHLAAYDVLVDLKRIPELATITMADGALRLGAMTTHAAIARHPDVIRLAPALASLCASIANPRVRAAGTIGGNLCFAEPTADPPVLLAALDATLHLASVRGARTVPAARFVTGPLETTRADDEILMQIEIPEGRETTRYIRQLNGHRSLVGAAASLPARPGEAARVWLGCLAQRPVPLQTTEERIANASQALDTRALRAAIAADVATLGAEDDSEASAQYREHVAAVVTLRAILAAASAAGREVTP